MAGQVQGFGNLPRAVTKEHALHTTGNYKASAHEQIACINELIGWAVLTDTLSIFQRHDCLVLGLDRVTSCLCIRTFR